MYKSFNGQMVNVDCSFADTVVLAKQAGFGAIEYDPLKISSQLGVTKALDIMGQNGVILSSFGLPVSFQGSQDAFNESFTKLEITAKIARDLGCKRCFTYVFSWSDNLDFAENFNLHVKRLGLCAKVLKEYGISLGLEFLGPQSLYENKKYKFINTLPGMIDLCDAIGTGNVGILMDAYHCYTAGMEMDEFLKYIDDESRIIVVHINDAPKDIDISILPDTKRYLPGEGGGIDLKKFLVSLNGIGYTGPVVVEPFSEKLASMEDSQEKCNLVKNSIDSVWI